MFLIRGILTSRKPCSRSVQTVSNVMCFNDNSCQVFLFDCSFNLRRPAQVGSREGFAEMAVLIFWKCTQTLSMHWAFPVHLLV